MLTEARKTIRLSLLSIKYALQREMLNKVTFLTNIIFMILNNCSFLVLWIVLYSLKSNIGGYSFNDVILLWGIAAGTYGFSHFFFKNAYDLSETINNGKLDSFLVQPKNVLLSCITSSVDTSALGDMLYALIMLLIAGASFKRTILYLILIITGGTILTAFTVILNSLSFWFSKTDIISETFNGMITSFATYPDGIFKGITKTLLFILPVGITSYIPLKLLIDFNIYNFLLVLLATVIFTASAFIIFNKGLKRYSSSNLMIARV